MKLEVSEKSFEKYSLSEFKEDRPVGDELFHADKRTDMTKLIVALRNFANEPKNSSRRCPLLFVNIKQRYLPNASVFLIRRLGTF
jgi:hypothetical protein